MDDKRTAKRKELNSKSEVHSDEGMTFSNTLNISSGGIYISTPEPLKAGSEIRLSIQFPDSEEIEIMGRVKWINDTDSEDSHAGMGIEFINTNEAQLAKIKKFVN